MQKKLPESKEISLSNIHLEAKYSWSFRNFPILWCSFMVTFLECSKTKSGI